MPKNWTDIHSDFDYYGLFEDETDYQAEWEGHGFTFEQVQEWINIGLTPQEANFCAWLESEGYTALEVLDFGEVEQLKKDYQAHLLNPPPKPTPFNFPKPNWKLTIILALTILIIYFLLK